jgi:hypothetical protein
MRITFTGVWSIIFRDTKVTWKQRSIIFLILFTFFFVDNLKAQPWLSPKNQQAIKENHPNLFSLQQDFQSFMENRDTKTKGLGYKQYKRWEWYWQSRVLPNGDFPEAGRNLREVEKYRAAKQQQSGPMRSLISGLQTGTWESIAQTSSNGEYDGIGRVNCVAFHPTDVNIFYAGTPGGGIWKTTDGGSTWVPLSDNIAQTGVTSIVVDPVDPNIIYIGTGDGYGNLDVKGIGVLKSINGGATWQTTGLSWVTSQQNVVSAMEMSPTNTSVLVAATTAGLYKTTDAGATWTQLRTGRHQDVKFKPGDGNTLYTTVSSSANIFKSVDGGTNWTQVTSLTGVGRINIAVTVANPSVVAAIASKSAGSGFEGFYYSNDSGVSFTKRASTPNLLGWNAAGSDTDGQGWYDLCIAISPTDANRIFIGGINTWASSNGGTNWSLNTHWSGAPGVPTVHADKHYLAFSPVNTNLLIQCNDGGIYKTQDGTSWTDITNGLAITMYYRIVTAQTDGNIMLGGTQDNGGRKRSASGVWSQATGGDGMDVAIDYTNANIMYSSYPGGNVYRSKNQFGSSVTISNNIAEAERSGWLSPYTLDPNNPSVIYLGYKDVFKTTNQGDTWVKISNSLTLTNLSEIAVSKSSPGTLYATDGSKLFKTVNDGVSWAIVTPTGLSGSGITYIAVSPTNANSVWVTLGSYNAGIKVMHSTDGGSTWTNISGTLPNVPINCIIYEEGSNDALYIGGDIGIYYRNATMADWAEFNSGLPNCENMDLAIQYSTKKLRVGTWGRGVWQTDLFVPTEVCSPPSGVASSEITSTEATISWSAMGAANTYDVQYKKTSSSVWINAGTAITATSVELSTLEGNTTYEWRVRGNCTSGSSSYSGAWFTTPFCDVPTNLTSSDITYNSANVNWTPVSGLNYTVEYKLNSSSTWTATTPPNTSASSLALASLAPGVLYDWRVKTNCATTALQDIIDFPGGTITSRNTDSPSGENVSKLIDNISTTKYLTFNDTAWVQFKAATSYVVTHYAFTSANDADERDPIKWTLEGSNDGTVWSLLDSRDNEDFTSRYQRREFSFTNTTPYSYYKIVMKCNSGNTLQLAEWELLQEIDTTLPSVHASAQFSTLPLCEYPSGLNVSDITSGSVKLNWTAPTGATSYIVEYKRASSSSWINLGNTIADTHVTVSDLLAATVYDWRVKTNCSLGSGNFSVAQFTTGLCDAPSSLTSVPRTTSSLLSWSSVTSGANYTAEYKESTSSTWIVASPSTTASLNITGLTAGTVYDWRVKSKCESIGPELDLTNLGGTITAQFTDSPESEDIQKLIDNLTSTKFLTNNSSAWVRFQATGSYVVTRYALTSANDFADRDPLNWTFQGSNDGSTWATLDNRSNEDFPSRFQRREFSFINAVEYSYYRLLMTNNSGTILQLAELEIYGKVGSANSVYSTTAQFTTPLCDSPLDLSSTAITVQSATISWSAISGANGYDVDYKTAESSSWTSAGTGITATSVDLSALLKGTTYDWRVRTNCTSENSIYSSAQFTTLPPCNPATGLSSSAITSKTVTLTWDAVGLANTYDVDYKTTASSTWTSAATATGSTTVNVSDLIASTAYDWRVMPHCTAESGAYATEQFTTMPTCESVTGLSASAITSEASTLTWTAVAGADSYSVEYKKASESTWQTATAGITSISFNLTDLSPGTVYDCRVKTTCAWEGSSYSEAQFTTMPTCDSPANLASSSVTIESATLSWSAVNSADTYDVDYKLKTSSSWTSLAVGINTTSSNVTGLTSSAEYDWRVRSNCAWGSSDYSTAKFTTLVTSIDEAHRKNVEVYPSPVGRDLNINTTGFRGNTEIRILDIHSRKVMNKKIQLENNKFDVSELSSGVYIMEVLNGNEILRVRFTKE